VIVPFQLSTEVLGGDVHVTAVSGELDLETAPKLEAALDEGIGAGARAVVIDLTNCEFIDSTGLAVLVRAWRSLGDRDGSSGRLVLCCPDEHVKRLFKLTGLDDAIEIFADRDEAVASVSI